MWDPGLLHTSWYRYKGRPSLTQMVALARPIPHVSSCWCSPPFHVGSGCKISKASLFSPSESSVPKCVGYPWLHNAYFWNQFTLTMFTWCWHPVTLHYCHARFLLYPDYGSLNLDEVKFLGWTSTRTFIYLCRHLGWHSLCCCGLLCVQINVKLKTWPSNSISIYLYDVIRPFFDEGHMVHGHRNC